MLSRGRVQEPMRQERKTGAFRLASVGSSNAIIHQRRGSYKLDC